MNSTLETEYSLKYDIIGTPTNIRDPNFIEDIPNIDIYDKNTWANVQVQREGNSRNQTTKNASTTTINIIENHLIDEYVDIVESNMNNGKNFKKCLNSGKYLKPCLVNKQRSRHVMFE